MTESVPAMGGAIATTDYGRSIALSVTDQRLNIMCAQLFLFLFSSLVKSVDKKSNSCIVKLLFINSYDNSLMAIAIFIH
jgi:hypothetical protein